PCASPPLPLRPPAALRRGRESPQPHRGGQSRRRTRAVPRRSGRKRRLPCPRRRFLHARARRGASAGRLDGAPALRPPRGGPAPLRAGAAHRFAAARRHRLPARFRLVAASAGRGGARRDGQKPAVIGSPRPMLRFRHAQLAYLHDLVMAAISFPLAMWLRVGEVMSYSPTLTIYGTLLVTAVAAVVFRALRLYRGIWRYASLNDLINLVRAVTLVVLIFVPILFVLTRAEDLPRSVPIIEWGVLLVLLGGPRFAYRILKDRRSGTFSFRPPPRPGIPVLLAGVSDAAELFIRATRSDDSLYSPVGMIAGSAGRVGRNIHGIEVLGTFDDLPQVVERLEAAGKRPQRLILTLDDLDGATVRRLVDAADRVGMTVARLPKLTELRSGVTDRIEVRPVAIEDLLGRPQTVLDREGMRRLV